MARSPSSAPHKRARGSYAKFICFACRERRIKCQLPDNLTIRPSSEPQPPETSCRRCQQQGLDCIVRKTTLGRPNLKHPRSSTPPGGAVAEASANSRSPSPAVEDFVLLNLSKQTEKEPSTSATTSLSKNGNVVPTSAQAMEAVGKTFESTLTLMARDRRFGRDCVGLQETTSPLLLSEVVSEKLASTLDKYLVWQRLYMPHLPSLPKVFGDLRQLDPQSGQGISGTLLAALLCSVALDAPTDATELTSERHLQPKLQTIIFNTGQKMLFGLSRSDYTLMSLELITVCRPLALMGTRQAAAQCLSGRLYPALIKSLSQRLDLDCAPARLRASLDSRSSADVSGLVYNSLRWAGCLIHDGYEGLGVERSGLALRPSPTDALTKALDAVADAIEQGRAPADTLLPFYTKRTHADELLVVTLLAKDWQDLPKLATHVHEHIDTQLNRKAEFERHLVQSAGNKHRDTALALSQLFDMGQNVSQADCLGLACFLAIMSTSMLTCSRNGEAFDPVRQLNKYYTECINAEVLGKDSDSTQSGIRSFLDLFGDPHMNALERRLTDFINAATDLRLQDVAFTGPPATTAEDVTMACKMIVENNAVRTKLDGTLHPRVDMQLILFQEAARRLEAMEYNGDGQDAVARGSVLAASAKLIRSLHRILWQWKRSYVVGIPQDAQQPQTVDVNQAPEAVFAPSYGPITDDFFADGFFTDWQNWPQAHWDPNDMSNMFSYDFDGGNL